MAIDVSFRDGYSTSAQDLSRFNKNFLINEGVANDGLKVSQSAVPAMSVQVTAGTSYFYGTGTTADTMFEFYSDSTETVTIPTASAQARIDIVCCKVDASTGVASLVVVSGTPSGSPAVPATPASHYKLANVAVGAGVTTITNANITDTRRTMFMVPTGARNQGLINGKIVPSVASNNLTVAIKTLQNTDPSPANPVYVWIDNTLRTITSAKSWTLNAGTNYANAGSAELATREIDYFVYAGWCTISNSVDLLVSRIPYAKTYNDFNYTATNEKAVFGYTGGTVTTSDSVVNVGRFAATLSASASFNWSVPTFTNANLIQEPIYETRRLDYLPTYSGEGALTYTSVTTNQAYYQIIDRNVFTTISAQGTTGGTVSPSIITSMPFVAIAGDHNGAVSIRDATSGAQVAGWGIIDGNTNLFYVRKIDTTNYGLGTGRNIKVRVLFPIA